MSTLVANATRPNRVCDTEMPPDGEKHVAANSSSTLAFSVVSSPVTIHSNPVVHFERANAFDFNPAIADAAVSAAQNLHPPAQSATAFDISLSNSVTANSAPLVMLAATATNKHNKKRRLLKGCHRQLKRLLRTPGSTSATSLKQPNLPKCKSEGEYQVCQHCCPSTEALQDLQTKYAELSTEVCSLRRRLIAVQHAFTSLRTMLLASFPIHSERATLPSVESDHLGTEHIPCQIAEHPNQSQERSYDTCFQNDCNHNDPLESPSLSLPPLSVKSTDTCCTLSAVDDDATLVNPVLSETGTKNGASCSDSRASPMSVGSIRSVETTGTVELYSSSISPSVPQTSKGNVLQPVNSARRLPNYVSTETDVETQRRICDILSAAREAMAQANTESCSQPGSCSRRRKRSCDSETQKRIKCEPKSSDTQDPVPDGSTSARTCSQPVSCDTDVKAIAITPQTAFSSGMSSMTPPQFITTTSPTSESVEPSEPLGVFPNVSAHSTVLPSIPGSVGFTIPHAVYENPQLSDLLQLMSLPSSRTAHLPCTLGSQISSETVPALSLLQSHNLQSGSASHFSVTPDHGEPLTRATIAPSYVTTVSVQEPLASHSQLESTGAISVQLPVGVMPVPRNVIFLTAAPATALGQASSILTKPVSSALFTQTTPLSLNDYDSSGRLDTHLLCPATQATTHPTSLHVSADSALSTSEDSLSDRVRNNATETIGGLELTSDQLIQLTDRIPPLDVFELAAKAKNFLREFNVSQRHFGEVVLNMSQASVSDILNKPRPWTSLPSRWRLAYLKLHIWLQQRLSGSDPLQWAQRFERLRNKCTAEATDVVHTQTGELEQTSGLVDSPRADTEVTWSRKREHSGLTANSTFGTPSKWARSDMTLPRSPQPGQSGSASCADFERQSLFDIAKAAAAAMQRANSSCSFKAGKLRALADSPTVSTGSSKPNTPMKSDPSQLDLSKSPASVVSPAKYSFGRNRVVFTPHQKEMLVASFNRQPYPHSDRLRELATELDLSYKTVLNWFHNRRMRSRQPRPNAVERSASATLPVAKPDNSNMIAICESPVRNCSQVFDAALSAPHSAQVTTIGHPEPTDLQIHHHPPSQPGHANRRKRPDPSRLIAPCL